MQHGECLEYPLGYYYSFLKKTFRKGVFPSSRDFCFSKCLEVLTVQSLEINQRTHKPFPHP